MKHITAIVVLPLTLFYVILAFYFINSYKSELKLRVNSNLDHCRSTISNIFGQIDTYYRNSAFDSSILNLVDNPIQSNNGIGSYTPTINAATAAQNMHNFINPITQIYLYSSKSEYVYGLYGYTSGYFKSFADTSWYNEYQKNDFQSCIFTSTLDEESYLTFCYSIKKTGALIIKVSLNLLYDELNISETGDSIMLINNDSGNILFKSGNNRDFSKYPSAFISDIPATLYYYPSDARDKNMIAGGILFYVLLALFTMITTVALSFMLSKTEYSAILSVISEIQSPYIGSYTESEEKLMETIDKNTSFSRRLTNELTEKISELKKNQLIALQSQINPHFISNTLNMISSSIMMNNEEDTDAIYMISQLSNILQYSLQLHEYIVPLESELSSLKSYITILNLRIGNAFSPVYDIPESIKQTKTLKFLMQPVTENAVVHGIQPVGGKRHCTLTVKAYERDGYFYIEISNDGKEIEPKKLDEIKKSLDGDIEFTNRHIGLKNVVSRIKLVFGQKGGCTVDCKNGITTVTIYHPII